MMRRPRRDAAIHPLMIAVAVVVLFPILFAVSTSLKTAAEVNGYPPTLWPHVLDAGNYRAALAEAPLPRFLLNSLIQAGAITLGQLVTATLAALRSRSSRFQAGRRCSFCSSPR